MTKIYEVDLRKFWIVYKNNSTVKSTINCSKMICNEVSFDISPVHVLKLF